MRSNGHRPRSRSSQEARKKPSERQAAWKKKEIDRNISVLYGISLSRLLLSRVFFGALPRTCSVSRSSLSCILRRVFFQFCIPALFLLAFDRLPQIGSNSTGRSSRRLDRRLFFAVP